MSHDTTISPRPTSRPTSHAGHPSAAHAPGAPAASNIAPQRQALQARVAALHQAGALPSAQAAGQPASAVQWNNWSNG